MTNDQVNDALDKILIRSKALCATIHQLDGDKELNEVEKTEASEVLGDIARELMAMADHIVDKYGSEGHKAARVSADEDAALK